MTQRYSLGQGQDKMKRKAAFSTQICPQRSALLRCSANFSIPALKQSQCLAVKKKTNKIKSKMYAIVQNGIESVWKKRLGKGNPGNLPFCIL